MSDERSPYETGVCPACGEQVAFARIDVTLAAGPVEYISGRWMCRTVGCRYGLPATMTTDDTTEAR
jgi:hypothetical protein